jgi:hypothetical protein
MLRLALQRITSGHDDGFDTTLRVTGLRFTAHWQADAFEYLLACLPFITLINFCL